jgi:hypothetical protein
MNKQTKIILWIIGILIVLLLVGNCVLKNLFRAPQNHLAMKEEQWLKLGLINDSYCEVQTINETAICLPEGVCEFQTDLDGIQGCLAIRE